MSDWSDWQDPWAMPFPVTATSWYLYAKEQDYFGPGAMPGSTLLQDVANGLRDIIATGSTEGTGSDFWINSQGQIDLTTGHPTTRVRLGYSGAGFGGAAFDDQLTPDLPPFFAGLTPGIDYASIPGYDGSDPTEPNQYIQYESTSTDFDTWDDLTLPFTLDINYLAEGTFSPTVFPLSFWSKALDTAQETNPMVDGSRPWLDYEDGTVLLHHDVPITPLTDPTGFTDDEFPTAPVIPLGLSGLADMSVVIMPRYLDPTADIPGPEPTATIDDPISRYRLIGVPLITGIGGETRRMTWPDATIRYTSPRWRYWIPSGWHTVGGHFATKGGVTPQRLTPGHGWVDIVDGPA